MGAFRSVVFFLSLAQAYASLDVQPQVEITNSPRLSAPTKPQCLLPDLDDGSELAGGLCINRPSITASAPSSRNAEQRLVQPYDFPPRFFWGDIYGVNYLTVTRNQHIPQYCGSCWAFGTTSAISDRIKILRRNKFPEIILAPQVLINCNGGGSCQGGTAEGVYRYMAEHGLPDETCQNYRAMNQVCTPTSVCQNCGLSPYRSNADVCEAVEEFKLFYLHDFGSTESVAHDAYGLSSTPEANIMAEIFKHGPVSCTMYATQAFDEYKGGIFSEYGNHWNSNHIVSLVGWGIQDGIPYWIGRNSWGTYWGENGFFRIYRGDPRLNLGIESGCSWALPKIPEHFLPQESLPKDVPYGQFLLDYHNPRNQFSTRRLLTKNAKKKKSAYDIRNQDGISFASVNINQNNPIYCESSWAQAASSALNDRFALLKNGSYPEVFLAVQVLLNCVSTKASSACGGGTPADAYSYILKNSIPDESCAPYEARKNDCDAINTCKSCWPDDCYSLRPDEYTHYSITNYGTVYGDEAVQSEIRKHGPVACSICDSESFLSYRGGIFYDATACGSGTRSTKYVALSGWGEENGVKYWIGRNSWGNYWGEDGWFRLAMGDGDLNVTNECHWAIPEKPHYVSFSGLTRPAAIGRIKLQYRIQKRSSASTLIV